METWALLVQRPEPTEEKEQVSSSYALSFKVPLRTTDLTKCLNGTLKHRVMMAAM